MRNYGLLVSCFLLVLVAAIALACGSSPRTLQSVSLSPATADAQGIPVQFTATGYYNNPPSPVKSLAVTWGACYQGQATTAVTVSTSGLARCGIGAVGTYTVWAFAPTGVRACPALSTNCGGTPVCTITGTAQLTCP